MWRTCYPQRSQGSFGAGSSPAAEHRAEVRRMGKAKTDPVSECALAILALMLAR